MKKQYRYKTAAELKDFFTRNWFDELNDLVGELHDAIYDEFSRKSKMLKLKDALTGAPGKMCDYIDAYAFPKDNCAKIMSILSNYESWYASAWTFLEQDSYDKKLMESINKCDLIDANLTKFASEKGAEVTTQLDKIYHSIEQMRNACGAPGTPLSTIGFDSSKNHDIQVFLNALTGSSDVENVLNSMLTLLGGFISEIGGASGYSGTVNPHYWTEAEKAGSQIKTRTSELRDELRQERANMKEDAEAERNKKKNEKMQEELDVFDKDDALGWINAYKTRIQRYINTIYTNTKSVFGTSGPAITSAYPHIANQNDWNTVCHNYFNGIWTKIDTALTDTAVENAFDNQDVRPLVNQVLEDVKKQFNKATADAGIRHLLEINDNSSTGPFTEGTSNKEIMKEFSKKLEGLFKMLLKDLYNHSVA